MNCINSWLLPLKRMSCVYLLNHCVLSAQQNKCKKEANENNNENSKDTSLETDKVFGKKY